MFKVIFNETETIFDSASDVANFVFEATGEWGLAMQTREVCENLQPGEQWEDEEIIIINCCPIGFTGRKGEII